MNIVLAGMPLGGKSTVAKEFLSRGFTVYDSDEEIVKLRGDISKIFENFGEGVFRDIESEVLEELSKLDGVVISLGGGSLMRERNLENLKRNGKIIYLEAGVETLLSRIGKGDTRPLIRGNAKENLERLYAARKNIFERAADIIVNTEEKTPQEIADEILKRLK